ncbi:DUF2946 domain-containing protein [Cronobacter turicensis]|uniref:DUF2946 domain-containing protein n=1 Tax=Cronobacter turicensis TaxID=413502 RepID=UPI0011AD29AE|nr:DUF2946 domain-containing protein [Cronobacter turicensis]EKY3119587.1 DUF2946 domain-containing protein [Cronobacter turicensis]ELU8456280.1 DUF2946 domain-containing protein [Cronobacter turicensis]ELY4112502.1 DUF2946 domain-containing protein [Cronobacter turicensis]ELY4216243.1 DUF2946 domain-containing protein [Cronobacter turicensis]EMA1793243.1 DUF2946 domain-containing protein [Cronobacter turicensis]
MGSNIFYQSVFRYRAALLALFAILLIVVAPLISVSLQKDPMSAMPGMHHDMPMADMGDMADMHQGMHHEMSAPQSVSMPVDHAEACGYCVLLAHVPGLLLTLALLVSFILQRVRLPVPRPVARHWRFYPRLWPDTRAPPRLSAFSC